MRFRLAFWHRDYPAAQPGDVIDVPDDEVPGLVRAGIGQPVNPSAAAPSKARTAKQPASPEAPAQQ